MTTDVQVDGTDVASAERLFENWLGFDIHGAAPRRLKHFLVARAGHLGYDTVHDYLDDLPPDRPTTAESQRLVNILTNGLTAFWRDPLQLDALGSLLFQLGERYQRTLDVWCAGCATGEEAYSVAIAAKELDVPVRVLGTDINTLYLDEARRANFDAWSLRRMSAERRSRWFEERGGRWAIDREIASMVEFRHHNLLDSPPVPPSGAWDAVLCRNVIIYLTEDAVSRILVRFAGSIAEDGYLLLGSAEQIGKGLPGFRTMQKGPTFVYRSSAVEPGKSLPVVVETSGLDQDTAGFSDQDAVLQLLHTALEHGHDEAVACFEAAASYDPFASEIYALLGLTMRDVGAPERALQAFGKVLFLDADNWWAAIRRAEIYDDLGDHVEAHRHYRLAVEGLSMRPGAPFDPPLAVGPLANIEQTRGEEEARAVRSLDRLLGGSP